MRPPVAASFALIAGLACLSGCTTLKPGGSEWSDDAFTWYSTPHQPTTVTLQDTRTGQALWTYEVPVGRQLSIQFFEAADPNNMNTPDEMRWQELPIGTVFATLENVLPVPNKEGRRVDWIIRSHPEFPKDETGAPSTTAAANPNAQTPQPRRSPGFQDTRSDY
jgi:hypothetical protein